MIAKIIILTISFFISDDYESIIREYLTHKLTDYNRFEIKIKSMPGDAASLESLLIDEKREFKLNGRYGYVPVELLYKNGRKLNTILTTELKLFKDVFVATHEIKKGQKLTREDFKIEEKEIAGLNYRAINQNNEFLNILAKTNINTGDILTIEKIEGKPVIKVGDQITAYWVKGNIVISLVAQAREQGSAGEKIQILGSNNKIYRALIKDSKNVFINE